MAFKIEQNEIGMKGDLAISLTEPVVLGKEEKELLDTIVDQVNMVLYTIIPGMKIAVHNYGMQLMDSEKMATEWNWFQSVVIMPAIPIRMESEGIIRFLLNIDSGNLGIPSICLAIDECLF